MVVRVAVWSLLVKIVKIHSVGLLANQIRVMIMYFDEELFVGDVVRGEKSCYVEKFWIEHTNLAFWKTCIQNEKSKWSQFELRGINISKCI